MAIILSIIFALVLAPSNAFADYTVKKDFNKPKASGYAEQHFALKETNNNLPLSKAKIDLSCKKSGALKWNATTRWNGWLKETLTGVCAITKDLTSSDKVTIRWKKWALDQYGRHLDFVMIITDFKVSHGRDSYYPIIANFKGGNDQRLIFATPVHESSKSNGYISGLGFTVTAKFVLPDTNTTVPGSYTMSFIDIDFQDYLNNKKAGTTWAEQIIASESQSSDKIAHLHSSTWLSESAASNGKFHNSHSVGSNKWHADSDEDERKAGFAVTMKNPFTFTWRGSHCWTFVYDIFKTTILKKKTNDKAEIGTGLGTGFSQYVDKWDEDPVGFNGKRTYSFRPSKGCYIKEIRITDQNNGRNYNNTSLKASNSVFKDESGYQTYTFSKVTSGGSIYVAGANIKNLKYDIKVRKRLLGDRTDIPKGKFKFIVSGLGVDDKDNTINVATDGEAVYHASASGNNKTDGVNRTLTYVFKEVIPNNAVKVTSGPYKGMYKEIDGNNNETGYYYDPTPIKAIVTITNSGETQHASIVYEQKRDGEKVNSNRITNYFKYVPITIDLKAKKVLNNKKLEAKDYSFQLINPSGEVIATSKNDAEGVIHFKDIPISNTGTYTYRIKEVIPDGANSSGVYQGVAYDKSTYRAKVTVTATSSYKLKASIEYLDSSGAAVSVPKFVNTYSASGTASITVNKEVENATLSANQFTFKLKGKKNTTIEKTAKNDANGKVTFDLSYTQADAGKTFTYAITEVAGNSSDWEYDTHTCTVTVTATDNGKGTINTKVSYSGGKTFTNTKEPPPDPMGGIKIIKTDGSSKLLKDAQFTITNSAGKKVKTLTTGSDGVAQTSARALPLGKYTVKETVPPDGYSIDTETKTVNITKDKQVVTVTFTDTEMNGKATIHAFKELEGATLTANLFSFDLTNESQNSIIATAKNTANGNVSFTQNYGAADVNTTKTYYIRESLTGRDNTHYDYDNTSYRVVVTISSTLKCTVSYYRGSSTTKLSEPPTFTNTYSPKNEATLSAKKVLSGGTLTDGQFSFELVNSSGTVVQTKTNNASGTVTFNKLTGLAANTTYNYKIREKTSTVDTSKYSCDTTVYDAIITTDSSGKATVSYKKNGSSVSIPTFTNTFVGKASATISARKVVSGGPALAADQFTFELVDSSGTVVATQKNKSNGKVTFTQQYQTSDNGKTKNYTIRERVNTSDGNYIYDETIYKVNVSISKDAVATVSYARSNGTALTGAPTFTNVYNVSGSASLKAKKVLRNIALKAGQFSFELRDSSNRVIQTKTNDASGNVVFDDLVYKAADVNTTKTYTIKEVIPSPAGAYDYDSSYYTATVVVNANGSTSVSYTKGASATAVSGVPTFTNTYTAHGSASLSAKKVLQGATLANGQFTFLLLDTAGHVVQSKKNNAAGTVSFDTIEYSPADNGTTKRYIMKEDLSNPTAGYEYDNSEWTVEVVIAADGQTHVRYIKGEQVITQPPTFTNAYTARASANLAAVKVLEGAPLAAGEFSFQLMEGANVIRTATNNADGSVIFDSIPYDVSDNGTTKEYTIRENPDNHKDFYTYDSTVYRATVSISADAVATVRYYRGQSQISGLPQFTNRYNPQGAVSLEATKNVVGTSLQAGQFTFELLDTADNVLATSVNDAAGHVVFPPLATQPNATVTYKIKEKTNGALLEGYDYDNSIYMATVTTAADGTPTVSYKKNNVSASSALFTNVYTVHGSAQLEATKTLIGAELRAGDFSFQLKEGNQVIETVSNEADGRVLFSEISYPVSDNGTTKTYTISEVVDPVKTWFDYDTTEYSVKVSISADGKNTSVVYENTEGPITGIPSFTNTYNGRLEATLNAVKVVDGTPLSAGQFMFQLLDAEKNLMWEAPNAADGSVSFIVNYGRPPEQIQTYTYYIRENCEDPYDGYDYDESEYRADVTVAPTGEISIAYTKDDSPVNGLPTFTNVYTVHGSATFRAHKTLEDAELVEGMFSFQLFEGDRLIQTVENDSYGDVVFDTIEYLTSDNGSEKTYRIIEVPDTANRPWFSYDNREYLAHVSISQEGVSTISYSLGADAVDGEPVFENSYNATGSATITVEKRLSGKTLAAGDFHFQLKDGDGQVVGTQSNLSDGTVSFDLTYGIADLGVHDYTIVEVDDHQPGIIYDAHEESVSVLVLDYGQGRITTIVTYNGEFLGERPVFENRYAPTGSVSIVADKVFSAPLAGGDFQFELRDAEGYLIATQSNDAQGHVAFESVSLAVGDIGTKHWRITEIEGESDIISYDDHVCYVDVVVADRFDGTLSATVTYAWDDGSNPEATHPEGPANRFTNTKKILGGVKIKKINDHGNPIEEVVFNIYSQETGRFVEQLVTDANGFASTEADALPAGEYFLVEKAAPNGYCVDFAKKNFTISTEGILDLSGEPIVNHEKTGHADIKIHKEMRAGTLSAGQFTFQLLRGDTVVATAVNDAAGDVVFGVDYGVEDIGNSISYRIREVAGEDPDMEYDTAERQVTVTVTETPHGLSCVPVYGEDTTSH